MSKASGTLVGTFTISGSVEDGELDAIASQPVNSPSVLKTLVNKTALQIAIEPHNSSEQDLIIPPFGARHVVLDQLDRYRWNDWWQRDLITLLPDDAAPQRRADAKKIPAALDGQRAAQIVGIGLIPLLAGALPALFVLIEVWEMRAQVEQFRPLTLAVLAILVTFVVIASTFPGGLYFLFQRQQITTLRQKFLFDIMRLCPIVQTIDDVEKLYGQALTEAYGCTKTGKLPITTFVPIWLSTFLFSLGWSIVLMPTIARITAMNGALDSSALASLITPNPTPIGFGFLGTYFFALNFIFRRYVQADLGPKAYTHLATRVMVTIILVWLVGTLPYFRPDSDSIVSPWLLVLSFFVGIIPETGTAILHDFLQTRKVIARRVPSLHEALPLFKLEGITLYDRARLLEEGIDNIEKLAHHNIVDLMLQTRIPTPRLVDLVDQAVLYLHVQDTVQPVSGTKQQKALSPAEIPCSIQCLRAYGIRTATDLQRAYRAAAMHGQKEAFLMLLGNHERKPLPRLRGVLDALEDDEWIAHLCHWRNYMVTSERSYRLYEFYHHSATAPIGCSAKPWLPEG